MSVSSRAAVGSNGTREERRSLFPLDAGLLSVQRLGHLCGRRELDHLARPAGGRRAQSVQEGDVLRGARAPRVWGVEELDLAGPVVHPGHGAAASDVQRDRDADVLGVEHHLGAVRAEPSCCCPGGEVVAGLALEELRVWALGGDVDMKTAGGRHAQQRADLLEDRALARHPGDLDPAPPGLHVGVHLAVPVGVEEVTEDRRGQAFAFVMDTRRCDAAVELCRDADLASASPPTCVPRPTSPRRTPT